MLKKSERFNFLIEEAKTSRGGLDILDAAFVDRYIEKVEPNKIAYQPYGAHIVPILGRDLSELSRRYILKRRRVGISGGEGFPTWVYSYELYPEYRDFKFILK